MSQDYVSICNAHARAGDWPSAVQSCLRQLAPIPDGANLGILYLTTGLAAEVDAVLKLFREKTGVENWVGTVGIGICAPGAEYYETCAVAVMVGRFPTDSFRVFNSVDGDFADFDAMHGAWCRQSGAYFGISHGDPTNPKVSDLVEGLVQRMDGGFLVGGLSSSRTGFPQVAGGITSGGLSGVLFSPEVNIVTRLTQGCSPIGPRRTITMGEANVIMELDGRPALDVFRDDVGEILARDLGRVGGFIFAGLPIHGSDTGDYLVRNLVALDPVNKAVAIAERIDPGDSVVFCRRDADSAREDLRRMLGELGRALQKPPKGGVYHSCVARGASLFGPDSAELKLIESELGTFPLVGFYANGEIYHNRLYGYTGVLSLFT